VEEQQSFSTPFIDWFIPPRALALLPTILRRQCGTLPPGPWICSRYFHCFLVEECLSRFCCRSVNCSRKQRFMSGRVWRDKNLLVWIERQNWKHSCERWGVRDPYPLVAKSIRECWILLEGISLSSSNLIVDWELFLLLYYTQIREGRGKA
jgi:hypothetical protein